MKKGRDVIFDIDWQGASQLKKCGFPKTFKAFKVSVFLTLLKFGKFKTLPSDPSVAIAKCILSPRSLQIEIIPVILQKVWF